MHYGSRLHIYVNKQGVWLGASRIVGAMTDKAQQEGKVYSGGSWWVSAGFWDMTQTPYRPFKKAVYGAMLEARLLENEVKAS